MEATARRVAARHLTALGDAGLLKFQRLTSQAKKELQGLPRLFKTYDRQAHAYKGSDPVKAKQTLAKIQDKISLIHRNHAAAVQLVDAFNASYEPTTDDKRRIHDDDFMGWFGRYLKALKALKQVVADDAVPLLGHRFEGYLREGENPLLDLDNDATSLSMLWQLLVKADPDPVNIPAGGSDTERFLAFLTPSIRRLAKEVAAKLKQKKNPAAARPLIWLVLQDLNAHHAASLAESLLPYDGGDAGVALVQTMVTLVSHETSGVVDAAAFGVALLQEVGDAALAQRLTKSMAKEFSRETRPD